MFFVLQTANVTADAKNCVYPNRKEITTGEELKDAVRFDHVCGEFKKDYRNISNVQVSFEINPKDIVHGLREIRLLLENLRQGQFSFEVNLQKQLTQWQLQLDYVCDFNWAVAYDNYLLGEAPVWADRPLLGRYENVSREELVRCTREIFRKPNMTLAIRGPKNKICTGEILRELELFPD